jgi:hypothetical protein
MRMVYKLPSRKAITSGMLQTVPDRSLFAQYLIKYLRNNQEAYLDAQSFFF